MIVNLPTEAEIAEAKMDADMERTVLPNNNPQRTNSYPASSSYSSPPGTNGFRRIDSGTGGSVTGHQQNAMMSPVSLIEDRDRDRPSTGEREDYQREWSRVDGGEGERERAGQVEFDEYGYRRDVKAAAAREREM